MDQIETPRVPPRDTRTLQAVALERISKEKEQRVAKFDKPNYKPFKVGELVLAKNHRQKSLRFVGPY